MQNQIHFDLPPAELILDPFHAEGLQALKLPAFLWRPIPAGGRRLDAETGDQVLAPYLPNEAHAQLHERKAVALWLGEFCKLLVRHPVGAHSG